MLLGATCVASAAAAADNTPPTPPTPTPPTPATPAAAAPASATPAAATPAAATPAAAAPASAPAAAVAVALALFVCVTAPSFPGLPTRTPTLLFLAPPCCVDADAPATCAFPFTLPPDPCPITPDTTGPDAADPDDDPATEQHPSGPAAAAAPPSVATLPPPSAAGATDAAAAAVAPSCVAALPPPSAAGATGAAAALAPPSVAALPPPSAAGATGAAAALPPPSAAGATDAAATGAGSTIRVASALAVAAAEFTCVTPAALPETPISTVTTPFNGLVCTESDVDDACCCNPTSDGCGTTGTSPFTDPGVDPTVPVSPAVLDGCEASELSWVVVPSCGVLAGEPAALPSAADCPVAAGCPTTAVVGVSGGVVTTIVTVTGPTVPPDTGETAASVLGAVASTVAWGAVAGGAVGGVASSAWAVAVTTPNASVTIAKPTDRRWVRVLRMVFTSSPQLEARAGPHTGRLGPRV